MADVFISYSRRDKAYVERLQQELVSRGKDVWVDVEGIRDAEVFPAALRRAVESSDAFVFVISPESVRSQFCEQEVDHAVELNKRVVPLAWREVPAEEVPEEIRFRNWIPVGDVDFADGVDRLVAAIETDLEWERQHTRLTVKALEWDQADRDRSFLVRGSELAAAEQWLAAGADKDPGPNAVEQEYLLAARAAASRRQRTLVGVSGAVAGVSIALLVFALISRGQAIAAQSVSNSRALAAESGTELTSDPEVSILLAINAVRDSPTPEALYALRQAIDQSPIRRRLPSRGTQSCGSASPGLGYAASGDVIAEAACDGTVILVEDATGRVRARWKLGRPAGPVAFSPDGRTLAVGTAGGVAILDVATGKLLQMLVTKSDSMPNSPLCGFPGTGIPGVLAFSRSGDWLAASYNWNLDIWRRGGGVQPRVVGGPDACIAGAAFDPSGASIIVGNGHDVEVIDTASGRRLQSRTVLTVSGAHDPARPAVTTVAVSPNGRLAAIGGELDALNTGTVDLWNTRTWRRVAALVRRPAIPVGDIRFSPDGSRIAIGDGDGTAGIWSVATQREMLPLPGHVAGISSIAFRPDGREIVTASIDGEGRVWRATANAGLAIATGAGVRLTKAVVSGDRVWAGILRPGSAQLQSWTMSGAPAGGFTASSPPFAYAIGFSGNGRVGAIVTSSQEEVLVRDLVHNRTIGSAGGFSNTVFRLALDATGARLAVASIDGSFSLYDVTHGMALVARGSVRNCGNAYVAFSADGRRAVGVNYCGQGILWNARSGKRLYTFDTGVSTVSAVSLDAHGLRLAVSSWDRTTVIHDFASNRTVYVLRGDTAAVVDVAFNPDGTWIATASQDHDVRIWNAANGQLLRVLPDPSDVTTVAFTPDGTQIVTTDSDGVIHLSDACSLCGNATALLHLGATRVTRQLTPDERRTFGA